MPKLSGVVDFSAGMIGSIPFKKRAFFRRWVGQRSLVRATKADGTKMRACAPFRIGTVPERA